MKKQLPILIVLGFMMLQTNRAVASPIAILDSATGTVGDSLELALRIAGLGGGTALGVFNLTLGFDPTILAFAGVTYGDTLFGDQLNLEGFGTITLTTPGAGQVELFELSFDSPDVLAGRQLGDFTLATMTFRALAPGQTPLIISVGTLGDQLGRPFAVSTQDGRAIVNPVPVPEPSTLVLIVSALGALLPLSHGYGRKCT